MVSAWISWRNGPGSDGADEDVSDEADPRGCNNNCESGGGWTHRDVWGGTTTLYLTKFNHFSKSNHFSKFNHFSRSNRQTSQSTSPGPTLDLPTLKSWQLQNTPKS